MPNTTVSSARAVLLSLLAQLCTLLTLVGTFLLGYFLRPPMPLPLLILSAGALLVLFVWGIVRVKARGQQLSAMRAQEIQDFLCERRDEIAKRTDEAEVALRRVARRTKCFLFAELLLTYASAVFLGALGVAELATLLLPFYFALTGVFVRFFHALFNSPRIEKKDVLSKEEFAGLYAVAQRAADTLDVSGELLLMTDESFCARIIRVGSRNVLALGACLVAALSEEELYNVLLHEFAHVSPRYTPRDVWDFYHRFLSFESPTGISFGFFTVYPEATYLEEHLLYTMLASAAIEAKADAVITEHGSPVAFASALAKTAFALSYERVCYRYLKTLPYATPTPPTDFVSQNFAAYLAAVGERAEIWLARYEREIRPRNATHPVYRERRDALGVTGDMVTVSFALSHDPLQEERARLLALADSRLTEAITPSYQEMRRHSFLANEKTVADYEKNKARYASHSLTPVIDALVTLARYDEAEHLCDEIIESETNRYATAYARFFKGYLRLLDDDPCGIPLLYEAAELNASLAPSCFEQIGEFVCLYGLEPELEEYRARSLVLAQKMMDESGAADILTPKDVLLADPMDAEKRDALVAFVRESCDAVKAIYLVRKTVSEGCFVHDLVLAVDKKADLEAVGEAFGKIARYLEGLDGERYSLFCAVPQILRIVRRVPGALLWSDGKK